MEQWDRIMALISAFEAIWPNADFGPAHIVLSDYNLDDGAIHWCLRLINVVLCNELPDQEDARFLASAEYYKSYSEQELRATRALLTLLLEIPESERDPEWDDGSEEQN